MSHQDSSENNDQSQPTDFLWGAAAIGKAINLTERQAYHLLQSGRIEAARKVGARFVANARELRREFGAE